MPQPARRMGTRIRAQLSIGANSEEATVQEGHNKHFVKKWVRQGAMSFWHMIVRPRVSIFREEEKDLKGSCLQGWPI